MAFNPLKNKNIIQKEAPIANEQNNNKNSSINNSEFNSNISDIPLDMSDIPSRFDDDNYEPDFEAGLVENVVNYDNSPVATENMSYEGERITDLQATGIQTEQILEKETPKIPEKQQFNLPLLESLSLKFVLIELGATKIKDNLYSVPGPENSGIVYDISVKENKWYNTNPEVKSGSINSISLVKHILALRKKIDPKENQKSLFVLACQFLNSIQSKVTDDDIVTPVTSVSTPVSTDVAENKPNNNHLSKEENKQVFAHLIQQLNDIDLDRVMEYIGANPNEDGHRGKWKVWSSGDNIAITGQNWYSWKAQKGGIGAIGLLAFHLGTINNLDDRIDETRKQAWKMAFNALRKEFGDGDLTQFAGTNEVRFKEVFYLPEVIDFKLNDVRHYLNKKRGIPLWIVNKQIKSGVLYAGYPSDWGHNPKYKPVDLKNPNLSNDNVWAIFLSSHGTAAEMRAIDRYDHTAKLLATGSEKEFGGFIIKAEKNVSERTVATLEASIDSLSYHAFYPGRIAMSCMGVNFKLAVKAAVDALDSSFNFQFAFDNDQAGNEAAIRFRQQLITTLGEEEYLDHDQAGRIHYFDLGIRCLKENLENNEPFYLDVQDNQTGYEVVKLFQNQAGKKLGKEVIKKALADGNLKYLNICPTFEMVYDVQKEAQLAIAKLNSGKPFYLRIKTESDSDIELTSLQKQQQQEKINAFTNAFKELAGDKFFEWERNGLIINSKISIAKDWNEYFIHTQNKNLEFKEQLAQQEKTYVHYSEKADNTATKKKGKKP